MVGKYTIIYGASICLLSVCLLFLLPKHSLAAISESDIDMSVNPEHPGPFEDTHITLSSYSVNLDVVNITWLLNGKVAASGIGKKEVIVTTGEIGSVTTVAAQIVANGTTITKTAVLQPSVVDLLWEAPDTYVPPFYKGKALPAKESIIRIYAIPVSKIGTQYLRPDDFTYSWSRNYHAVQDASGFGKNVYAFTMGYLENNETIELTTQGVNINLTGGADLTITPSNPVVRFYVHDPLLGTQYEQVLASTSPLLSSEETIVGEPYFMSPKNIFDSALNFQWTVNKNPVPTPPEKNILTVKTGGNQGAQALLGLTVQNVKTLFQQTANSLTLTY